MFWIIFDSRGWNTNHLYTHLEPNSVEASRHLEVINSKHILQDILRESAVPKACMNDNPVFFSREEDKAYMHPASKADCTEYTRKRHRRKGTTVRARDPVQLIVIIRDAVCEGNPESPNQCELQPSRLANHATAILPIPDHTALPGGRDLAT